MLSRALKRPAEEQSSKWSSHCSQNCLKLSFSLENYFINLQSSSHQLLKTFQINNIYSVMRVSFYSHLPWITTAPFFCPNQLEVSTPAHPAEAETCQLTSSGRMQMYCPDTGGSSRGCSVCFCPSRLATWKTEDVFADLV